MTKLKLAVVGAGHLGRIHARLLAEMPDVELVGVADPVPSARESVAADCHTRAFADHQQLLGAVEAAVIATPTRFHHAVALDFLQRGTPLLVEKPLTLNPAQADELVSTAARSGAVLQVGHIERFNPAFVAARRYVRDPKYVEAVRASGFTGRSTDIGVVHDLMIHDIDLLLSMVDAPVERVTALGLAILGRHEDVAQARIEFAGGCVANLSASRVSYAPGPKRQMHVWCADRFAAIDFGNRTASIVSPCQAVLDRQFDYEALSSDEKAQVKERMFNDTLPVESLAVESRNALVDELRDFIEAIRSAGSPQVDGAAGQAAVNVAEMVLESIRVHCWHTATAEPSESRVAAPPIIRPPHWTSTPLPAHREAG